MSVPNIVPIVRYSGTGEQKEFYIPFPYLDKTDLVVRSSLNGAMSEADYEVNGKYITFVNAPADKEVIAILRKTVVERIADYDDTGAVSAASLNDNFDRPLLTIQEIEEVLSRCVQMDPTSGETPEGYLDKVITITENAKDVSLNAAVSAANSAQTAATSERNIGLIWAEITGDPTLAENALITLKEAAEATGAITAAKELAIGEVRNTGAIAVAATEKAADEAREAADIAANTAGSISQTVADQITIQVSQAAGANGILGVAIETGKNVVESARQEAYDKAQEALNKINAGNREFTDQSNAALIQIQGKVDSVAIDVQAALERAQIIAGNYLKNAQATVSGSIADLEQMKQQAGSDTELIALINKRIAELQELQGYLTDAESAKTAAENFSQAASSSAGSASASASSAGSSASNAASKAAEALQSAQSAATSASNAAASAVAASTTATEVSNQLLTVHNASREAHPALMRGQITNPIILSKNVDLNDFKTPGYYHVKLSVDAATILNSPTKNAFALEVYGDLSLGLGIVYQRLTEFPSSKVFIRRYYHSDNDWMAWEKLAFTKELNSYIPVWGGQMTTTLAMRRNINNSYLSIFGGTATDSDGAQIDLCGANHPTMPGVFLIHARNSSKTMTLQGDLNGSLVWNCKNIVRSVNGTAADAAGNVVIPMVADCTSYVIETWTSGTSWYRKWSDGWIEQGGVGPTFGEASSCTITLNVPFTTTSYTFQGTLSASGGISHNGLNIEAKTTSTVRLYSDNRTGGVRVEWYACGY